MAAHSDRYIAGRVVMVASSTMSALLQKLCHKDVVLSTQDTSFEPRTVDVTYVLHHHLRIPHWCISLLPHKPENFLVWFDYPEQRDTTLRTGSLFIGATPFFVQPWNLQPYTRPMEWFFHVNISVEHLLVRAWSA
jgi:hypothetical protein